MIKHIGFLLIDIVIISIAGIICFKKFKNFKTSIYWLLFPNIFSVWQRKLREEDLTNTFRFELFILLIGVLIAINFLVFKYIL